MKVTKNPNYYAYVPGSMSSIVRWLFASPQIYVWSVALGVGLLVFWATASFQPKPSRADIAALQKNIATLERTMAKQIVQLLNGDGGKPKPEDSYGCYEPYKWNATFQECSTIRDH